MLSQFVNDRKNAKMAYNYADVVLAIPAVIGLIVIGYLVLLMIRIYLIERLIIQSFMQTDVI